MKTPSEPSGANVRHFSYGSILSSAKFKNSRDIRPLVTAKVRVSGWRQAFNIPGIPYSETAFTSIVPHVDEKPTNVPEVAGVAYLIFLSDCAKIIASEGGGTAYSDVELDRKMLDEQKLEHSEWPKRVRTLGTAIKSREGNKPSVRYLISLHLRVRSREWQIFE